jgi:hypothetical protein
MVMDLTKMLLPSKVIPPILFGGFIVAPVCTVMFPAKDRLLAKDTRPLAATVIAVLPSFCISRAPSPAAVNFRLGVPVLTAFNRLGI